MSEKYGEYCRLNEFAGKGELFDVNNNLKLNIVVHSTFGGRNHIKAILEIGNELKNILDFQEVIISETTLSKGFLDNTKMRNMMKKRILNKGIPLIKGYQTTNDTGLTMEQKYSPIYTKDMPFIERFYFQVVKQAISLYYLYQITHMENKIREKYRIPPTYGIDTVLDYGLNIANTYSGFEPAIAMLKRILQGLLLALEEGIIDGVIWGLGRIKQSDFPFEVNNGKGSKTKVRELFEGKNPNIKLLPWAPQVFILDHKNTKLFLLHSGLESTFKAIHSGTLVLCLALFADQARNARKIEETGIGLYVGKFTFTPKSLKEQLKIAIEDKDDEFKSNLSRMRTISHHNSRRLNYAADLFEQHTYTAKACRKHEPYNPKFNLPPCEIKHLIPVSDQMSYIKAKGIHIYGVAILLVSLSFVSFLYSLYYLPKLGYKFYKQLTTKAKTE
ncbi:UDP-Glycosyltransferase/glycogen phosphorylase [Neoconidiobolus thromboides FSU 785]|nr:UDP-Glycosyltransferase/glycogen phosphorylase [Neoconidiobolus thromboides FSU 785]